MENFLKIIVPEGRRPGKWLRKKAPIDFGSDFSALVTSLEYDVSVLNTREEYEESLITCTSCQSSHKSTRELYYYVWSSFPDVVLISLNDETGSDVARCLINTRTKTRAGIYGAGHFLLKARLDFFSYKEGEIQPFECLRERITETLQEPPSKEEYSEVIPKSIQIYIGGDKLHPPTEDELRAEKELRWACGYWIWKLNNPDQLETEEEQERSRRVCNNLFQSERKKLVEVQQKINRYRRQVRKTGSNYGDVVTTEQTTHCFPVKMHWEYKAEETEQVNSEMYDDHTKNFIHAGIKKPAGWYRNNVDRELEI